MRPAWMIRAGLFTCMTISAEKNFTAPHAAFHSDPILAQD
jgi:hypothetical protein